MSEKQAKEPPIIADKPSEDKVKIKRSTEQDRISELEKALALSRQREQLYCLVLKIVGHFLWSNGTGF